MSIRFTRTADIAHGKFMEAIAWGKETAAYIEKKWGTPPLTVWLDAVGKVGVIHWSFDLADLAALDKIQAQMMADQGYWQLVNKAFANQLFVDGSSVDRISRQV
jgi:hypothetical protein